MCREDDWKVVSQLMVSTLAEDFEVSCLSACALAFLGNIYNGLWRDYSSLGHMQTFGAVTLLATSTIAVSVLKEYEFGSFTHELVGMDDFSNADAFAKTWVLLITQILQGIRMDNNAFSLIDIYASLSTERNQESVTLQKLLDRLEIEITAESDNANLNQFCKLQIGKLIQMSNEFSPDIFSDSVSAIVWANALMKSDICPFAEIPWMICLTQFRGDKQVDYSEVILHHLNEVGYPYHGSAECVPIIQLCIDMIKVPTFEGFFYYNDTKVIVDTIIRELQNIPDNDSNAQTVRTMYVNLLEVVVTQSAWKTNEEQFKKREMLVELNSLYERNGIFRAGEVLQILEAL